MVIGSWRQRTLAIALMVCGWTLASVGSTVQADWWRFWSTAHKSYHRNVAWPDPFNEVDAIQTVTPFEMMKQNGWRQHNTIGHALFRQGDGALLASGQNRVRWIATQAPVTHREIYVMRGQTNEETQARVKAVRDAVENLQPSGPSPQVFVTAVEAPTVPGAIITKISRDRLEALPIPKLPDTTAAGNDSATQAGGG